MANCKELEAIVASVYEEYYESVRRGYWDFPDKKAWIKEKIKEHKYNHPELWGYVWDEENQDWVRAIKTGCHRMIINNKRNG